MDDYDGRSAALWASTDEYDDERAFRAKVDQLVAELPSDSPIASFERECAWDSTGHSDRAIPLYRLALEHGLEGERDRASDALDDAVSAFLALALVDSAREREAVSVALGALAPHLPRYQRSLRNDARDLVEPQ